MRTDLVTTLALSSLRRHAPAVPLRLVNCDPTEDSRAYFATLATDMDFEVVETPVRPHGQALDDLFSNEAAALTLLLDSDAEVLNPDLVPRSVAAFMDDRVFGAGFVHGPGWLGERQGQPDHVAYYQERAWLPFVIFRTAMVQEALVAGHSFSSFTLYNDVAVSRGLSRLLASRFPDQTPHSAKFARLPRGLRRRWEMQPFDRLAWLRRDFYGQRPNYVYYDTGASVYQYCKYERDWIFVGTDARLHKDDVAHYHGVTRQALHGDPYNATGLASVKEEVKHRLAQYGLHDVPE